MPDLSFEKKCRGVVVGVDEAGRGPWAGPVVAGAVILPNELPEGLLTGLDDSKKLKAEKRESLLVQLKEAGAVIGVGIAGVAEIDTLNILQATLLAMSRAVEDLGTPVDLALIDGNRAPALSCAVETVIKGDSKSLSIAAASIVAKVTRDEIMKKLSQECPGYGWERNAGYGTREHQDSILCLGITRHHRCSFAPIRKYLNPQDS